MKVRREDFIPSNYRDYAYREVPLPLPGKQATISCPHSYPLFYEPLSLDKGHRFLEVGLGSGYGSALAREIVGSNGLVVCIEIDPLTFEFGQKNLKNAGYHNIVLIKGDGGLGYPEMSPYDRICITAACHEIPPPLIEQLTGEGKLIGPVAHEGDQNINTRPQSTSAPLRIRAVPGTQPIAEEGLAKERSEFASSSALRSAP